MVNDVSSLTVTCCKPGPDIVTCGGLGVVGLDTVTCGGLGVDGLDTVTCGGLGVDGLDTVSCGRRIDGLDKPG